MKKGDLVRWWYANCPHVGRVVEVPGDGDVIVTYGSGSKEVKKKSLNIEHDRVTVWEEQ